jgi:hypothetical protein
MVLVTSDATPETASGSYWMFFWGFCQGVLEMQYHATTLPVVEAEKKKATRPPRYSSRRRRVSKLHAGCCVSLGVLSTHLPPPMALGSRIFSLLNPWKAVNLLGLLVVHVHRAAMEAGVILVSARPPFVSP